MSSSNGTSESMSTTGEICLPTTFGYYFGRTKLGIEDSEVLYMNQKIVLKKKPSDSHLGGGFNLFEKY